MNKKENSKLLNYTTEIEPIKTAGEIMGILASKHAQAIMIEYERGEPTGLSFKLTVKEQEVFFKLPCNVDGAFAAMQRMNLPPRYVNKNQAKRTAWRIVKNWVEAQMAIIDCGQAEMAEIFLPYAITNNGQTFFQRMQQNPNRLLAAGDPESEEPSNVIDIRRAS